MKKITKKQAMRRRIIFKTAILISILFSIYYLFFKSALFKLKILEIEGNNIVKREEIIENSGFKLGNSIFKIDKKSGENRIKKIPYIKDIKIKNRFPNKLKIIVKERKPSSYIYENEKYIFIDDEGRVLHRTAKKNKLNFPETKGLKANTFKEGSYLFKGSFKEDYLYFMQKVKEFKYLEKVKIIDIHDKKNIVLYLETGEEIHMGNLDEIEYKLKFLDGILYDSNNKKQKIAQIFFNKGENPIVVTDK